jgi:hypothetical protein
MILRLYIFNIFILIYLLIMHIPSKHLSEIIYSHSSYLCSTKFVNYFLSAILKLNIYSKLYQVIITVLLYDLFLLKLNLIYNKGGSNTYYYLLIILFLILYV